MIGSLGFPELLFILVLALLIFGPRKLPEIGKTLGRALGEFRRATSDLKRTLDTEMTAEEYRMPQPPGSSRLPRKPREPAEADGSSSDGRQTAEQATADEPATETGTEPG